MGTAQKDRAVAAFKVEGMPGREDQFRGMVYYSPKGSTEFKSQAFTALTKKQVNLLAERFRKQGYTVKIKRIGVGDGSTYRELK